MFQDMYLIALLLLSLELMQNQSEALFGRILPGKCFSSHTHTHLSGTRTGYIDIREVQEMKSRRTKAQLRSVGTDCQTKAYNFLSHAQQHRGILKARAVAELGVEQTQGLCMLPWVESQGSVLVVVAKAK